ncbi:MAG TPA: hypothetical protein VG165_17620 [Solirubrobacteraceae bacterium]|jgi:hypothetical protein|nr:hypothetical protein [Solirubrobacteraceae bacterium]
MSTPNRYELTGGGLTVTYTTTGIDGQPHLQYHHGAVSKAFVGSDQIQAVETDLGTVVSVPIFVTIDSGSTSFSLLIPRVNMSPGEHIAISTDGITATHRFSVVPAFDHGQLDAYAVTPMHGTADIVAF